MMSVNNHEKQKKQKKHKKCEKHSVYKPGRKTQGIINKTDQRCSYQWSGGGSLLINFIMHCDDYDTVL